MTHRLLVCLSALCLASCIAVPDVGDNTASQDCASSFVQLTKELVPSRESRPAKLRLGERLREQKAIPRAFGGLKRAGEAAEAEAILDILRNVAGFFQRLTMQADTPPSAFEKELFKSEASVGLAFR
mmetsp:Transcript_12652/g.23835  ORF Transcript_12652/g.23835 Transcript_12652/m.23835 type:complete len:127 (+) Transcript_12652:50-430(+)